MNSSPFWYRIHTINSNYMSNKIRSLKPKMGKKSHFKQGYFDVKNSKKYFGPKPVIYRSGLEFKFMVWCERNKRVVRWTSEPTGIPYTCPETGKTRTYYIDFIVEFENGDKFLIEVKPFAQMKSAEVFAKLCRRNGKLPRIDSSNSTAAKNDAKWKHAQSYGEKRNMKFKIITERFRFV